MNPRPFTARARRLWLAAIAITAAVQVALLLWFGNGLALVGDPHSEADALRSASAYAHDGLTSHHGLPRILYGQFFPKDGTVKDHVRADGTVPLEFRVGFPEHLASRDEWVYTHYPPGPNLLCGASLTLLGSEQIWRLRLFPLLCGLAACAIFYRSLLRNFGETAGAYLIAACLAAPMFHTMMTGLHYEGWSFALLLLQLTLLLDIFFGSQAFATRHGFVLFTLGFAQGWLSFDQFFVVALLAVPLGCWPGRNISWQQLIWLVSLPSAGFIAAHGLHFFQVAAELGGWSAARAEFHSTAAERAGTAGNVTYLHLLGQACYCCARLLLKPTSLVFGPLLMLSTSAALWQCTRQSKLFFPLLTSAAVSAIWLLLMPQHVCGNAHITVRHFFVSYFIGCVVVFAGKSRTGKTDSAG
ncbi:MAG: hypothetical protein RLZZ350_299 [Verrucomicrobiota bacterium]|jgi:hypothetical protein